MKKIFFLLFFTCLSTALFSQNIPVTTSKSALFQDNVGKSSIVLAEKTNEDNLLIVRSYNNNGISVDDGFFIEEYDSNLQLIKDFNFELKHINSQKFNLVVSVFSMEGNIIIVNIYFDLNRKAYVCEANIINPNFKTSVKELFSFSKDDIKPFGTFSLQDKFYSRANRVWTNDNSGNINTDVEDSPLDNMSNSDITLVVNKTKTAFAIALDFNNPKADGLKLYLFDKNLNKKQEPILNKEIKDKKCIFQNIQIADDGNALFIITKSFPDELKTKKVGGKYVYEISKITASSEKTQQINLDEHFIKSLKTYFSNDKLICLGFYSDLKDSKYTGISYFDLNANSLEILNFKYNPFSQQFVTDKYGDKKPKALNSITFKNAFFNPDESLIVNAQEEFVTVSQTAGVNGMGGGGGQIFYHFNDIICLKLNLKGELIWARNINKEQSSTPDEDMLFISYTSIVKNDKTYLFINTSDKIKKLRNDRIEFGQTRKNKSNLNVIEVNASGDFDYKEILDDEQNQVPFMVSKGAVIDDNIYFLGRKSKSKQLLKVTL